jgi:hypothetical protein
MGVVPALPSPVRRMDGHLLGPPLPGLAALWQAGGRRGVTAAVCVVLPLVVGTLLDRPQLGAAGALGALTAIYGHALPYRRRGPVVAGIGAALTVAAGLGALTGAHPVALSFVSGGLAAAAAVATRVWRIGPPGPLGIMLVSGGASALGTEPSEVGGVMLAAAGGAALSWCGCMLPWLWDPTGPERRAVQAADRAVAAVEQHGLGSTRPGAVATAVRVAAVALADGSRRDHASLRTRLRDVEQRFLRALPAEGSTAPAPVPGPGRDATGWWHLTAVQTAVQLGCAATAAGLVATALGLDSPYWAATTAVAVQLGTGARSTRARAAHRAVGTAVGVLIAGAIIAADLPVGVEIALVGLLQLVVELLVAHKYGLAVAFITPLVLTLVHLGAPTQSAGDLIAERLAETGVGIAVALAAGLTLFHRAGSRRLPGAVTAAAEAAVAATRDPAGDRRLHDALVVLTEVATAVRGELFPSAASTAWLQRARWVADLGWALLGARARGDDELVATLGRRIAQDLAPPAH